MTSAYRPAVDRKFLLRLLLLALAGTTAFCLTTCCLAATPRSGDAFVDAKTISKGMSKDEVRAVLGAPDRDLQDLWYYFYGLLLAREGLMVEFGADNRVTKAEAWVK